MNNLDKQYKELLEPAIEIIKTNKILGEKVQQWREFYLVIAGSNFVYYGLLILSKYINFIIP